MTGQNRDSIEWLEQTGAGAGSTWCEAEAGPSVVTTEAASDSETTRSEAGELEGRRLG